jgi:hypothetical protein
MKDMNENDKLEFLTEIFLLTEDIRHELSYGDSDEQDLQEDEPESVESSPVSDHELDGKWTL